MYSSTILPLAQEDIREAAKWYNAKKKGLGRRFTSHVRKKVKLLEKNPKIAPVRYADVRTAVLDLYPFMIHYRVDDDKQMILILAVYHTSKNPINWGKKP